MSNFTNLAVWSSLVARQAHNLKVASSILATAIFCSCASTHAPSFTDTTAAVGHAQQGVTRAQQANEKAQASVKKSQESATEIKKNIGSARLAQTPGDLNLALDAAEKNVDLLSRELATVQDALTAAYTELGTVKGDLGQAQYTIQQHEKDMSKVQAQLDKFNATLSKYHRIKIIFAGAIMLVVSFFGLKIGGPYGLIAGPAAAAAVVLLL